MKNLFLDEMKSSLKIKALKKDKNLLKRLKEVIANLEDEENKDSYYLAFEHKMNKKIEFNCNNLLLLPSNHFGIMRDNILFAEILSNDDYTNVNIYSFSEKRPLGVQISYLDYKEEDEQLKALSNLITHSLNNVFGIDTENTFDYGVGSIHKEVNIFDDESFLEYAEQINYKKEEVTEEENKEENKEEQEENKEEQEENTEE